MSGLGDIVREDSPLNLAVDQILDRLESLVSVGGQQLQRVEPALKYAIDDLPESMLPACQVWIDREEFDFNNAYAYAYRSTATLDIRLYYRSHPTNDDGEVVDIQRERTNLVRLVVLSLAESETGSEEGMPASNWWEISEGQTATVDHVNSFRDMAGTEKALAPPLYASRLLIRLSYDTELPDIYYQNI